ncbi:MAG: 3-oxoacyl-ACP synthase [Bacteroidaceae bacterium]|nr:3-oxoacyl-ACP synthase [Bacteroidaceae bacterium]
MEETLEHRVARVAAHHALTPLADGSHDNFRLISEGRTAVTAHHAAQWQLAEDFMAGIVTNMPDTHACADTTHRPTRAEAMALHSIRAAMAQLGTAVNPDRTILVVSTTKGNIDGLQPDKPAPDAVRLGHLADTLCHELGITLPPITVSNACTSGVCALIAAQRAIECGTCDKAIVCGVEAQSRFIVSGFQSLHALSPELCQPFSANRQGLNVGEAAATIILEAAHPSHLTDSDWLVAAGAIRNDANHISGPSRTGEGSFRALQAVLQGTDTGLLAFVSVHGTATPYNDEMESIAIERAGLLDVPVVSLKGYFGHTMGAAGVLETIISIEAANAGIIPATHGYDGQPGVSRPVGVAAVNRRTDRHSFIKLISGFGGVNAAIRMSRGRQDALGTQMLLARAADTCRRDDDTCRNAANKSHTAADTSHTAAETCRHGTPASATPTIHITPCGVWLNGTPLPMPSHGTDLITACYRTAAIGYPKFYKMDPLCRLGFVASELLLQTLGEERFAARDDRAIVLLSRSGCLATDRRYASTICPGDDYFPSPSLFVYTLPNIVAGEIAIRNKYHGETAMYLSEAITPEQRRHELRRIARLSLTDAATTSLLTGWVDYEDAQHFEAHLTIVGAATMDSI